MALSMDPPPSTLRQNGCLLAMTLVAEYSPSTSTRQPMMQNCKITGSTEVLEANDSF